MKHKIAILIFLTAIFFTSQVFAHEPDIIIKVEDAEESIEVTVEPRKEKKLLDYSGVRVGIVLGSEMSEILFNDHDAFAAEFKDHILPGIYAEVMFGRIGIGATGLARFSKTSSLYSAVEYQWTISWIGSADVRFHFFKEASFIDPFIEGGVGCAGSVELPEYGSDDVLYDEGKLEALSLFAQIGGGTTIILDQFHIGAKVLWRVYNDVPPATQFTPIDVADFHVAIFAGVQF